MNAYRESAAVPCTRCESLTQGYLRISNQGLFPNQGGERLKHKCVFCGEALYANDVYNKVVSRGNLHVNDLAFCQKTEELKSSTRGFWWWKTTYVYTLNKGCADVPHLHRACPFCNATWIERTMAHEKNEKVFFEPTKEHR